MAKETHYKGELNPGGLESYGMISFFPIAPETCLINIKIDFGPTLGSNSPVPGSRICIRQKSLLNKQVICVVNFPPKQIGPFISECLVTGLYRENGEVVLAVPDTKVQNGARLG